MDGQLNFAGGGTHEIAALLDGALVAGHFDDQGAADAAIAALGDGYSAAWSTLNPLASVPDGRTLNPARLSRGSRAGARHVSHRASLLFDFDPPRPAGVMSTDVEHEAALRQARECRDWLHSMDWPILPLADSGSGCHLRPSVDMDAGVESTSLVQRTLLALHQKFGFVDVGMHDLSRLCRFYGTWNRKGANSVERPWRVSRVLDAGESTVVTVEQLLAVCELIGVPKIEPVGDGIARPAAQEKFIRRFKVYCERIGVSVDAVRELGNGDIYVQTEFCLRDESHTGNSCGVAVGVDGVRKNLCRHNGCAMPWGRWSREVEVIHGPMRLEGEIHWATKTKA